MFPLELWLIFTFHVISQKNIVVAVKNLQTSLTTCIIIGLWN